MPKLLNIANKTFFGLTALSISHKDKRGRYVWNCACICGNAVVVSSSSLVAGKVKSCGCLTKGFISAATTTHGQSRTPEYRAWDSMKARCLNKSTKNYHNYGGRGIKVCDRWLKFENFYADMGKKPSLKHSLDRIDNNGNYEKSNCRYATISQQANNKRNNILLTFNGRTQTVSQWSKSINLSKSVIYDRLKKHTWSVEKILTTPVNIKYRHKTHSLKQTIPPYNHILKGYVIGFIKG